MSLIQLPSIAQVETHPVMRRLKVCALVVKPCQTCADHDGQAAPSDLGGPQAYTRAGRMSHPRTMRTLRLLEFDRVADSLPKQKP